MARKTNYVTIWYDVLDELNISMLEYCILDMVARLSNDARFRFYCVMDKSEIASTLKCSESTLYDSIKKLVFQGLLEKEGENKKGLRVTAIWNDIQSREQVAVIHKNHDGSMTMRGKVPPQFSTPKIGDGENDGLRKSETPTPKIGDADSENRRHNNKIYNKRYNKKTHTHYEEPKINTWPSVEEITTLILKYNQSLDGIGAREQAGWFLDHNAPKIERGVAFKESWVQLWAGRVKSVKKTNIQFIPAQNQYTGPKRREI